MWGFAWCVLEKVWRWGINIKFQVLLKTWKNQIKSTFQKFHLNKKLKAKIHMLVQPIFIQKKKSFWSHVFQPSIKKTSIKWKINIKRLFFYRIFGKILNQFFPVNGEIFQNKKKRRENIHWRNFNKSVSSWMKNLWCSFNL